MWGGFHVPEVSQRSLFQSLWSASSPTEASICFLLTPRTWVHRLVVWMSAALPNTSWALRIPCAEKILHRFCSAATKTQFLGHQLETFLWESSPVHLILRVWGRGFFLVIASLLALVDIDLSICRYWAWDCHSSPLPILWEHYSNVLGLLSLPMPKFRIPCDPVPPPAARHWVLCCVKRRDAAISIKI